MSADKDKASAGNSIRQRDEARRERDEARLTRPHHGAQPAWYLQLAGNPVDQDGNSVRYRTADRRMITERDSQNVMAHVITHQAQPSRTDARGRFARRVAALLSQ